MNSTLCSYWQPQLLTTPTPIKWFKNYQPLPHPVYRFNPIPGGGPRLDSNCNNFLTTAAMNLKFWVPS